MNQLNEKTVNLIEQSRSVVSRATNSTMVYSFFSIGKMIVKELQQGENRAGYGTQLLQNVPYVDNYWFFNGHNLSRHSDEMEFAYYHWCLYRQSVVLISNELTAKLRHNAYLASPSPSEGG